MCKAIRNYSLIAFAVSNTLVSIPSASGNTLLQANLDKPLPAFCPLNLPPPNAPQYVWSRWGQVVSVDAISLALRARDESGVRRFMVSPTLINPKPKQLVASFGYQLADVRVGDVVSILYMHNADGDTCTDITIYRRPGGKVPHAGDDPMAPFLWHEKMQSYQDWEERGIPIPAKYLPVGKGVLGVPYPPVAPPPRVVAPKT